MPEGPNRERVGFALAVLIALVALIGAVVEVRAGAGQSVPSAAGGGAAGPKATGEEGGAPESGAAEETTATPTAADAPANLTFLCDGTFGAGEVNLDAEARDQVEERAREFVLTAYGDPGADAAKYEKSVEELVVDECFWQSLASGNVSDMEEVARRGGKAKAPSGAYDSPSFARKLVLFDIEYAERGKDYESGAGFTTVDGTAVWVGEESNGDARAWQESLTLAKSPDAGLEDWRVVSGQAIPPYVEPEYDGYLPVELR
jgi:hypothetical protein